MVDSTNYTDTVAVEDMNVVYHDLESTIVTEVDERFFWDTFVVSSLVADQTEYTIPDATSGNFVGLQKTLGISIKYDGTNFTKARPSYPETLEHDLTWYAENQDVTDPFFFIADNSYFIFPAPQTTVANGIRLYGMK